MIEISPEMTAWITRKRTATLWGQPHEIEPCFIQAALGDGNQLLAVSPLNTRPNYYLIRVDSKWGQRDCGPEEEIHEHIDDICEAIEDEVGPCEFEDDDGEMVREEWPYLDDENGVAWWEASYLFSDYAKALKKGTK